jgi:hypothetical protein
MGSSTGEGRVVVREETFGKEHSTRNCFFSTSDRKRRCRGGGGQAGTQAGRHKRQAEAGTQTDRKVQMPN